MNCFSAGQRSGMLREQEGRLLRQCAMESWNHSLKVEAIHSELFVTRQAARNHVFEYIEVYYNRKRLHSLLDYLLPEVFELRNVASLRVRVIGSGS